MAEGDEGVRIWEEQVVLPTYGVGAPDPNPMFLDKRVYQGSSGRVYPYPIVDRITGERAELPHRALFLENRWLKVMVLPEYGGRIHRALDKTNGYDFIYFNRVIKPALVGLAGPWLSGGVEFNWPQHHRPGTFCPVDTAIARDADGALTLWMSEIEPMAHMKGTLGLRLRPERAVLEIEVRLFNRTPLPQSFHLWVNPAVHVGGDYQSVFPPDVQAVFDHGKRDVSSFPIARGTYYKVDFSRGVDLSRYRNIPVPMSYMAAESRYDFIGGYDHGKRAGMLHVADHRLVPGKKQWVWGCGDFGLAWDRELTDDDGPYAELMCGVFCDNQPDFAWLQPFEEKRVRQFFLPYKAIGVVRNATVDAALSLEVEGGAARVGAYATSVRAGACVRLSAGRETVWEQRCDLDPEHPFTAQVALAPRTRAQELRLEVLDAEGRALVAYAPEPQRDPALPEPARAIPTPRAIPTNDELYFAGLHLEQYRHATRDPEDCYREALRRDPRDARCNTALGLLLLRRGQFPEAEPFLRAAIATLTRHNPNPSDGEAFYALGLCLALQERDEEACDAFSKSVWNAAWQDAGYLQLARIAARRGEFALALEHVERSLERNSVDQVATHLRALLLRRLGRRAEAEAAVAAALLRDPLDFGAGNERVLLAREAGGAGPALERERELSALLRGEAHTCLRIAADYAEAGAFDEACELLERAARDDRPAAYLNLRPMLFYSLSWYAARAGRGDDAARFLREAARQPPERCFPNSLDSLRALRAALERDPDDARAAWFLGNLLYDQRRRREALALWERSRRVEPGCATVHRNLAIAYYNELHEPAAAQRSLEKAARLAPDDARLLYELDLLRKRNGVAPARRLALLRRRRQLVERRDDLTLELVTLLNSSGRHAEALELLVRRRFHPWEGGEGKVTGQYVVALLALAQRALREGRADEALELLTSARSYPPNLGEGKLHGTPENQVLYHLGQAHAQRRERAAARACWEEAAQGPSEPAPALYYNDPGPECIYHQGLALLRLGREARAAERFRCLLDYERRHARDEVALPYFAVSLPEFAVFDDDLALRKRVHGRFLRALGALGLGRRAQAARDLRAVLALDPNHQPALLHTRSAALDSKEPR